MKLRPTHRQAGSARYRRPGGEWDVPTLDRLGSARHGDAARPGDGASAGDGAWAGDGALGVADARRRLTPGELAHQVGALAGGLRAAGVGRGDTVVWQLRNCIEAFVLFRACWRLGGIAVPVHHLLGSSEVERMLEPIDPKISFSAPGLPLSARPGVHTATPGDPAWEEMCSASPVVSSAARGSDLALGLFTSGSTGEPKLALHTHRGLSYKAITMVAAHALTGSDAVLMPAPLSHISGLLSGILIPTAAGMRVTLMERWDPGHAIELVQRERISFMVGPPTFFSSMAGAANFSAEAVASMRVISCGSMTVSPEFVQSTAEAFGASVKRTYGSTEAPTVTTSTWEDPPVRARETDGRAVGSVELRIADPDTGRQVAQGQPGELLLRGPELFCGYADPAQTRAAMARGWFRTGDLATLDAEGWLTIIGRHKDLIIRGGENIVPAEVERVLEAHPAIDQAVVVGYADDRLGQRVAACVIAHGPFGLAQCQDWFATQGIARFKTPEMLVAVDRLPLLSLGKPDRNAVAALVRRRVPAGTAESPGTAGTAGSESVSRPAEES